MIKNFKVVALSLLALILILNLVLFSRMGSLNELERSIKESNNQVQGSINSLKGQVNNLLSEIEKEKRWITPAEVDFTEPNPESGETTANLKWQIKEYAQNAKVTLYYRLDDKAEFTAIPVKPQSGGYFDVAVPLKVEIEPYWDMQISMRANDSKPSIARSMPVQDKGMPGSLSYYVSVEKDNSVKSSEIQSTGLEKLSFSSYGPLMLSVDINGNRCSISLIENATGKTRINSAALRVYNGETLISEQPLEYRAEPSSNGKVYSVQHERDGQNRERLVLNIKYDNGKEFQKEIPAY